jgi:putative glycosyltransferase (TIGR04372 family)
LADRPHLIFAAILDRTLGDFFDRNIFAATVKMCFKQAHLLAYYRDDRPYKSDVMAMNPYVDRSLIIRGNEALPIEFFYPAHDRFYVKGSDDFIKQGFAYPDIFLTPTTMMQDDLLRYEHVPQFSIPGDRRPALEKRLVGLGLDPSRWFCVIFHRDGSYRFRGSTPYRDTNDRPFEMVARHVIDELGGQVVRLGHPQMRRFDLPRDFIDLSIIEDEFMLQATAVSRARFMITAPAGPASLPSVFDVPHVIVNGVTLPSCCAPIGYLLTRHIFDSAGKRLDTAELIGKGLLKDNHVIDFMKTPGFRILDNTGEELIAATNFVHDRTGDCLGWRPTPARRLHVPPEQYVVKGPFRRSINLIEFPELWPKAT